MSELAKTNKFLTALMLMFVVPLGMVIIIVGQFLIPFERLIYEFRGRKSECTEFCNAPHHWAVHGGRIVCAPHHGSRWFGKIGRMLYGTPEESEASGAKLSRGAAVADGDCQEHSPTAAPNVSSRHPVVAITYRTLPSYGQHHTSSISFTRRHESGERLDVDSAGHKSGSAEAPFS